MALGGGLLEREDVTASAQRLVQEVAVGGSAALFVVGEAGLGKTSLIGQAWQRAAAAGLAVGLGRGHPMETSLPFGVLAQALSRLGEPSPLAEDEPGLGSSGDRAARFYGLLRWLRGRTDGGLVLALDDLHWADADSVALMSFVCRRMGSLRLGLIASLRPWPSEAHEAVTSLAQGGCGVAQRLLPLSEGASGSLLADRLGRLVPPEERRRAFALCAGNPLLLEQLAVAVAAGGDLPAAHAPGRAGFGQGVLLARFAGLPPAGMRCAQAASVLGASFLPEVAAQVAGLEGDEIDAALESLGRTGLIGQRPGAEADFAHPLFRQALYEDLAGPVRARLHARAFAVLHARGLEAQAAEHAVQGRLAGDPQAVQVLERAGRAARGAGALAVAVSRLDAAVTLAGDRAGTGLLLAQAEALLAAGSLDRAVGSYQHLLERPDVRGGRRVEALWMLGRALAMSGDPVRAMATFEEAATQALPGDPHTAAEVLLDAAFSCWLTIGATRALPLAARARKLARPIGGQLATRAEAEWGQISLQAGDPTGMAAAEGAAPWLPSGQHLEWGADFVGQGGGWGPVNSFAYSACLVERLPEADRAFTAARALLAGANAPEAIATLAIGHGYVLTRMGRLDEALAAVDVALPLVEIVPLMESFASVGSAYIHLYLGKLDDSARWCERVEATANARGESLALVFLWDVLGRRRLQEGFAAQACELYARLEATVARMGIGEPCLPPWARHAISAYLAAGRVSDAERIIGWLDQAAGRLPCRFPRIAAATGRAWLAESRGDSSAAEAHFRAALAWHDEVDLPLDHVETLLAYGAFVRRSGRRAAARPVLGQAVELADAASAAWLADLARGELRVAGGRQRKRASAQELTGQEQRVAGLGAAGASNGEIARQLHVSVSTVETHLERIYAKLGIHTRYELIARGREAGWGAQRSESSQTSR